MLQENSALLQAIVCNTEDAFSAQRPPDKILWVSVTSMHSALSVQFSAASMLSHQLNSGSLPYAFWE